MRQLFSVAAGFGHRFPGSLQICKQPPVKRTKSSTLALRRHSLSTRNKKVGGYLIGYPSARAIMNKLQIPDKEVDDIMLERPINDWLAKTKRYGYVCTTVGHVYSDYKDAEGVLLITHIKGIRRGRPEAPVERHRDKNVKGWLMGEGGAKEESLRWVAFPDGDVFGLLEDGTKPTRNNFEGRWAHWRLNEDQFSRMRGSGKRMYEWAKEAIANGEEVESIWPPKGHRRPQP